MIYQYLPNDPARYATALRLQPASRTLVWDNANGQGSLLVQTPFGQSAQELMETLCPLLEERFPTLPEQFTEAAPGVWLRLVTAADKARNGGCPLHSEASTYTVFACDVLGNTCRIYAPQSNAMILPSCDVPLEIRLSVTECTQTEGPFFRRREVFTGFYRVDFPAGLAASCGDGDLCCSLGELTIPVTRQMLEQGSVYYRTDTAPVFQSANPGLRLR